MKASSLKQDWAVVEDPSALADWATRPEAPAELMSAARGRGASYLLELYAHALQLSDEAVLLKLKEAVALPPNGVQGNHQHLWFGYASERRVEIPDDLFLRWVEARTLAAEDSTVWIQEALRTRAGQARLDAMRSFATAHAGSGYSIFAMTDCVDDPLVAEAVTQGFTKLKPAWIKDAPSLAKHRRMLGAIAHHHPEALEAAIDSKPAKLHLGKLLEALATSTSDSGIERLMKAPQKPEVFAAIRYGMVTNAPLREALRSVAGTKASKRQAAAAELMSLWEHRDPAVVARQAAVARAGRETSPDTRAAVRRLAKHGRFYGAHTAFEAGLRALAKEDGEAVWALLWECAAEHSQRGGFDALSVHVLREGLLKHRVGEMATQVGVLLSPFAAGSLHCAEDQQDDVFAALVDAWSFRPSDDFKGYARAFRVGGAKSHPAWMEALRFGSKRDFEKTANQLKTEEQLTIAALGPYLLRREYAPQAAQIAAMFPDASSLPFLEQALAASPNKKLAGLLEEARAACEAMALLG